jgi:polyisoprenyl-teichoic acid--peptidoglycan teichoic acid transferase
MSDVPPTSGGSVPPWDPGHAPRRNASSPGRRVLGSSKTPPKAGPSGAAPKPNFRHAKPAKTGKRVLKVGIGVVVLIAVGFAAVAGYGWYRFNQINRDSLALASSSGGVQNFLIVGSDSRATVSKSDANSSAFLNGAGAQESGQRSDTIMVARVDSKNKTIDLVSFPRDLWVKIQPSGEEERINTAFAQGKDSADGAQRLINTIKADFGIDINHYIEINFASFKGVTDAVNGIPMYFDKQVRDKHSGFYMYGTGCQTLDGEQALAYARARHLEYLDPKTKKWIEDPSADLGRISRQTLFMRTMLDRAQGKFGSMDIKAINSLVSSTADNLTFDSKLSIGDLVSLGKAFKGFSGDQIVTHALPVYMDMTSGGASILRLDTAGAEDVFNVFRGMPSGTVYPQSVVASVTNASGAKGKAVEVSERLNQLGFTSKSSGDVSKAQSATVIKYLPGFEKQADLLRRQLGGSAELQVDKSLKSSSPVSLVLGSSFTGVLAEPIPATTTTTVLGTSDAPTTSATGPVTTIKPGEITDFVGVQAGKAPEGVVCT